MNAPSVPPVHYILDTDTITFHQLGRPTVTARLTQIDPRLVATTVITLEEQLEGRLAAIRRQRDEDGRGRAFRLLQQTHVYFCPLPVLPFDEAAQAVYKDLSTRRLRIGTQDLRIAAITLSRRGILVTSNRRHFGLIPELMIDDWMTTAQ